jgi:hypothetical protein
MIVEASGSTRFRWAAARQIDPGRRSLRNLRRTECAEQQRHPDPARAFSGDAHAAGVSPKAGKPGCWDNMIGPGKAFERAG